MPLDVTTFILTIIFAFVLFSFVLVGSFAAPFIPPAYWRKSKSWKRIWPT